MQHFISSGLICCKFLAKSLKRRSWVSHLARSCSWNQGTRSHWGMKTGLRYSLLVYFLSKKIKYFMCHGNPHIQSICAPHLLLLFVPFLQTIFVSYFQLWNLLTSVGRVTFLIAYQGFLSPQGHSNYHIKKEKNNYFKAMKNTPEHNLGWCAPYWLFAITCQMKYSLDVSYIEIE